MRRRSDRVSGPLRLTLYSTVFTQVYEREVRGLGERLQHDVRRTTDFREAELPEVSRFFGIIIAMYYNDHSPPHFHAKYGGDQASIRIDNGETLEGTLGTRAMRLVEEWRALHQTELLEDWKRAEARQPLNKIEPLE